MSRILELPIRPAQASTPSLVGLVGALGDAAFAEVALARLNESLRAASWSVYQVWQPGARQQADARQPVLHLSASLGVPDTTRDCFEAYRQGLYRNDTSFDVVSQQRAGQMALMRMGADEMNNAAHREAIYRRHGVRERLSAVQQEADGSLFAVNLYAHVHQPGFEAGELERFADMAAVVVACVRRHVALSARLLALQPETAALLPTVLPLTPRERLQRACAELTPRELDVCERLLRGWSFDGVAADLGLSVPTVKTYRARAFDRLGIHFRNELFARFAVAA